MEQVKPIICSVARSGPKPILFLPRNGAVYGAGLPKGETEMRLESAAGRVVVAMVAKIAINVVKNGGGNILPEILKGWFGEEAGAPGTTKHRVVITRVGGHWVMAPQRQNENREAA
jgi:hypothetical protein